MQHTASESTAWPRGGRWWVVAGPFLGMMTFGASRYTYPYVLPAMAAELQLPNERMGNIASAYFVAYMLSSLLWGTLADRLGSRRVMLAGVTVIGAGLLAMGNTSSFVLGLLFNLLCGAGAPALSVGQVPLLSRWFPDTSRGMALGAAIMGNGFATFALGLWIPAVMAASGWRWAWWSTSALVFALLAACWFLLREAPPRPAAPRRTTSSQQRGDAITAGPPPTMWGVLGQRAAWTLIIIYSVWGAGYTIFMTFAVAYLRERAWDAATASGAFALWGVFTMFGAPTWGSLADRLAKKWVLALAIILQAIGYFAFLSGSPIAVFAGAAAVGFGQIGIPTVMSAAAGDYFPRRITGAAFGLLTFSFALGCIIGPSAGGLVSDASGTLASGLLLGLGGLAVAGLATLVLQKPPRQEHA
ncbi:MAG: MFS transporter [Chloroflexi bacterium]|nr:MFS transporter [Chloroflexota bacterium]